MQLCFAQNMIPNADWEMGPIDSSDPFTGWNSNGAPDSWIPIATPDRIVYGSPAISRDGDPAYSGDAYCVFYYDEGGKCELNSPLVAGQTYCLSARLDVDDNFDAGPGRISFEFQGDTIQTQYVTNTGAWQTFDTTFVATSNSDSLYLFANGNNLMKIDFMILDTVGCTSAQPVGIIENPGNDFYIYPNPSNDEVYFSKVLEHVKVLNNAGKIMLEERLVKRIVIRDLPSGIYYIIADGHQRKFIKN